MLEKEGIIKSIYSWEKGQGLGEELIRVCETCYKSWTCFPGAESLGTGRQNGL
jgi:hypothetical protein